MFHIIIPSKSPLIGYPINTQTHTHIHFLSLSLSLSNINLSIFPNIYLSMHISSHLIDPNHSSKHHHDIWSSHSNMYPSIHLSMVYTHIIQQHLISHYILRYLTHLMGLMYVFRCNVVMIMGLMFVDLMILSLMIMGFMFVFWYYVLFFRWCWEIIGLVKGLLRMRWEIEGRKKRSSVLWLQEQRQGWNKWMFKKCVKHLERLDPQFTIYQFKLIIKQCICGIWT